MDAVKFLQERNRMFLSGAATPGIELEDDFDPVKVVEIIERWSVQHPRRTRQDVFLEQWPNAVLDKDNVLRICPSFVGGDVSEKYRCLCSTDCGACRREFWMHEGGVK